MTSSTAKAAAQASRAELAVAGLDVRGDEHGAHGEAVGDALGTGDDIGADAGILVGEETSRAAVAALDFVADEQGACFIAGGAQSL